MNPNDDPMTGTAGPIQSRRRLKVAPLALLVMIVLLAACSAGGTPPPPPTTTPVPTETRAKVAPSPTVPGPGATNTALPGPGEPTGTPGPTFTPPPMPAELPRKGSPDAKVVMIEFSDYQCPYCRRFALETAREVEEKYIKAGLVQHIFLDFPFLGEESLAAAEASHCAQDQDRFWEYHDLLFENQSGRDAGAFSRENLLKFAAQLNLGEAAFAACLDSHKYRDFVLISRAQGQQIGVQGTPTIFINGQGVPGFLPFEDLQQLIEEALKEE